MYCFIRREQVIEYDTIQKEYLKVDNDHNKCKLHALNYQ